MLTCKKCGLELHEDQKVCIQCGTRTIRGDGFEWDEKRWTPSPGVKIGAGAVVLILLVVFIINSLKVVPPNDVTEEWFGAMVKREMRVASRMVTPAVNAELESRGMSLHALSEDVYNEVESYNAKYTFSPTEMQGENAARIQVTLNRPDGYGRTLFVDLVKHGRKWQINAVR